MLRVHHILPRLLIVHYGYRGMKDSDNQLQKCWDTPTKKRPFLLQIAPGHRSLRYNTTSLPPIQSFPSKFWVWSCIGSNFDKGWRRDHKHKIMDGPFMPKYGTVVSSIFATCFSNSGRLFLRQKSLRSPQKNNYNKQTMRHLKQL